MRRPVTKSKPAAARAATPVMARSRFPLWLIAVLLVLATIALYWPVTGYDFVDLDDNQYVLENPHVTSGLNLENARWAFTTLYGGLWHPLSWLSHMLDYQYFGLCPGWHHLTSLLLHVANTVLLLIVLHGMTGALWRSALVAALFSLHPLHVESVAWVAEKKDVLSTFFVLLTIWAYHRYIASVRRSAVRGPSSGIQHPATAFYLLSLLFFVGGLMSKPMVVTLPLVLLLLDYWPLKRFELAAFVSRPSLPARLMLEKMPFLLAALLTGLVTLHGGYRVGALPSAAQFPIPDRIANAILSYARYFLQAFWPARLAVFYPFPATFSVWSVTGAALLLLGISVAACCLARRRPYVVVGWFWFLATLLPVIGLIQLAGYSHADRYTYVPLIGLFVALVWGAGELVSHWRRPALACAASAIAAAMLLCLARTRQQVGYWKDSETLFRHAIEVTENNWLAHDNLGVALFEKGQMDAAISQCQEAIRLKPSYAEARNNLGVVIAKKGQADKAISQYQEAIRLKPDDANAYNNLGYLWAEHGENLDQARAMIEKAVKLEPKNAAFLDSMGWVLLKLNRPREALDYLLKAIENSGQPDASLYKHLGDIYAALNQREKAAEAWSKSLSVEPSRSNKP